MSNTILEDRAAEVQVFLEGRGSSVESRGTGHWRITLPGKRPLAVDAQMDAEWLTLRCVNVSGRSASRQELPRLWQFLCLQRSLEGGVRAAIDSDHDRIYLAADISLDERVDVAQRLASACAGFRGGACLLANKPLDAYDPAQPAAEPSAAPSASLELAALVGELDWQSVRRSPERFAFELEVPGIHPTALLEKRADQPLSIHVELIRRDGLSLASRQAMALLLLVASDHFRLIRPVAHDEGEVTRVGLEVAWNSDPAVSELQDALAAMSLACRACVLELEALVDESLALAYTRIRGWSSSA